MQRFWGKTVEFVSEGTLVATVITAIAAAFSAFGAIIGARAWKKSIRYERRCDAVAAWIGGAAVFRGALKFVYADNLTWDKNKKEIEAISARYWAWVALWPNAYASLNGEPKKQAHALWMAVFEGFEQIMSGGSKDRLEAAVEAVYNSGLLSNLYKNPA